MAVDYGPSPSEIDTKAKAIVEAAVRIKADKELRMLPLDHPDNAAYAGKKWEQGMPVPKLKDGRDAGLDEQGRFRGTAADWKQLKDDYSWIPGAFKDHLSADPTGFGELINAAQSLTKGMVNVERPPDPQDKPDGMPDADALAKGTGAVDTPIALTMGYTSDWSGAFADGFQAYLRTIPDITRRQDAIAQTLYRGAIAARDTYAKARVVLGKIADDTVKAIEGSHAGTSASGGKDGIIIAFAILGGAATVAAGIATLGTALPLLTEAAVGGWTIIAGASSTIAGAGPLLPDGEKPDDVDLAASTVDGVISKMNDALKGQQDTIDKMEKKFKHYYDKDIKAVDDNAIDGGKEGKVTYAFFPKRPNMLDMGTSQKDLDDPRTGFTHPTVKE